MLNRRIIIPVLIAALIAGISLFIFMSKDEKEFQLVPGQRAKPKVIDEVKGIEVGTGWSIREVPEVAMQEAVEMALMGKKDKTSDFAVIFATSGSDLKALLSTTQKLLGKKAKIYGGTSDSRAVMTEKGYVEATERGYEYAKMEGKRGLVIMTVSSKDIVFGVGSADFTAYPSARDASKAAILSAIRDAGKSQEKLPNVVLITPTIGKEEEVLEGIQEAIGNGIPVLGGTAGGPAPAVIGKNEVYKEGVSLAVIYTDLPVGWVFEGGFDVTEQHSGIVTKVDGQVIVEIDNRPALDVYDEWLGGKIADLYKKLGKPDVIRDLLTLHPIYRKYSSSDGQVYFLFSHPWPKDDALKERSVCTSTRIKVGERIYLSRGSWGTLVNRIGNLPRNAKINGEIYVNAKPLFGIGYICAGVMGVIPESERAKLPVLINHGNNDAPFIANFTWGEQGRFPGVGNKHGNLLTVFLVVGNKEEKVK